jgi:hypothetical protein
MVMEDVARPDDWQWSSYRAHVGLEHPPAYLDLASFHRLFGRAPAQACRVYGRYVRDALNPVSDTGFRRPE